MTFNRQPTLGVHLLETITRGMYSEPLHSIREYIQNSYDSIRDARRMGLLDASEGAIEVRIDSTSRTLTIRDNGSGLSPEAAAEYLLDLGSSNKGRSDVDAVQNAGFRGIGRMAGISYCNKLLFETSDGDGRRCTVEFDADGINRLTERGQKPATIVEAIESHSTIKEEETGDQDRYLQVTLEGVPKNSSLLKERALGDYLAMTAPVAFDPSQWSYAGKIKEIATKSGFPQTLDSVDILILDSAGNVRRDVRRPFKDTFETADARGNNPRTVKVTNIVPLPLESNPARGWWGWLAVHERHGALADVAFSGLRLRMHNIAVGDHRIIQKLFRSQNLARWCFGEIYVTDLSLMPNAQRDNFEESRTWSKLQDRFQDQAVLLEKEIRNESVQRNKSVKVLTTRAQEQIDSAKTSIEIGFVSVEEQQATIKKLERAMSNLESASKQRKRPKAEREQLHRKQKDVETALTQVRQVRRTKTNDAWAHLNKQSRNVLRTVFEVLNNELAEKDFTNIQTKIQAALMPGKRPRRVA